MPLAPLPPVRDCLANCPFTAFFRANESCDVAMDLQVEILQAVLPEYWLDKYSRLQEQVALPHCHLEPTLSCTPTHGFEFIFPFDFSRSVLPPAGFVCLPQSLRDRARSGRTR